MLQSRLSPILMSAAAVGVAALLSACGGEAEGPGDDAAAVPAEDAQVEVGNGDGTDDGGSEDASDGGIDGLYSDALHDGVAAAAPGTAYIEIEGERLEFTGIACDFTDLDNGQALQFTVEGDTAYGVTELSVLRGIGWGIGFDYEEEVVQVTHLGNTGGRGDYSDISIAQNASDEAGAITWYQGDGPNPMLQIVGSDMTGMGTLVGHLGSDNPQEGSFTMAANCG